MKVLSILQPWASLIVLGHKKIETRSWNTKYRGEIYIHASSKHPTPDFWTKEPYLTPFVKHGLIKCETVSGGIEKIIAYHSFMPTGVIVGKVNLIETFKFTYPLPDEYRPMCDADGWELTEKEIAFGDYSPGRYGWLLSNPVIFDKPIPAKGKLGIWDFELFPFRK